MRGFMDPSSVRKSDPLSIFREEILLDELDAERRAKGYRRKFDIALAAENSDMVGAADELLSYMERPWEHLRSPEDDLKYNPDKLMEMYSEMFPSELEKEKESIE